MIERKIFIEEAEKWKAEIREAAAKVHSDVNQFYDMDKPYVFHLDQVYENVLKYGDVVCSSTSDVPVLVFGAYFHDAIEDARLTYNDIIKEAKYLGIQPDSCTHCAEVVYALTNEKGRSRAERENDKYFDGLRQVRLAPFLKCCDRLANYKYASSVHSSLEKKYTQEMPDFLRRLDTSDVPAGLLLELSGS